MNKIIKTTNINKQNLTDSFGRFHNYLRIALLEKCNLRCLYCMPEKGIQLTPKEDILTTPEIIRLVNIFGNAGVNKIRLTGGEPTIHRDILDITREIKRNSNIKNLAITTNGLITYRMLPQLREAGLDGINVSLDTLIEGKYQIMTRRKGFNNVMKTITKGLELGFDPVKVNCVVMRNQNDDEINDFVALTKDKNINIRFIEYMPFDDNEWKEKKMVSFFEMKDKIQEKYGKLVRKRDHKTETAKNFTLDGHVGSVSFITSMTNDFCGGCNRTRLLADGNYKVCLFDNREISLRDAMRQGCSDEEILEIINDAIMYKKEKHGGMHNIKEMKNRPMITIGG